MNYVIGIDVVLYIGLAMASLGYILQVRYPSLASTHPVAMYYHMLLDAAFLATIGLVVGPKIYPFMVLPALAISMLRGAS